MGFLDSLYLPDVLHEISNFLLIPTVILLLLLILYSLYSIGSVLIEVIFERRKYRVYIPELVAKLEAAAPQDFSRLIDQSELLREQKDDLEELVAYLYLPQDARMEVARRLLFSEEQHYKRITDHSDMAAKVAPMLGLMGTLIPLGPGIVALGAGDTQTLASSLLVAFDTTVAGLATAVVCYVVSRMRKRWYADYLVSLEACFNTLLERADQLHEEGYEFERVAYEYDEKGRRAVKVDLDAVVAHDDDPASDQKAATTQEVRDGEREA